MPPTEVVGMNLNKKPKSKSKFLDQRIKHAQQTHKDKLNY
jgi:hypothetical protein